MEYGTDIRIQHENGSTDLLEAIKNSAVLELLLNPGAIPNHLGIVIIKHATSARHEATDQWMGVTTKWSNVIFSLRYHKQQLSNEILAYNSCL